MRRRGFLRLLCGGFGRSEVDHRRGEVAERRVGTPRVVALEPPRQPEPERRDGGMLPQTDLLVIQASPEPLDEHVVHPPAASVHADPRPQPEKAVGPLLRGELGGRGGSLRFQVQGFGGEVEEWRSGGGPGVQAEMGGLVPRSPRNGRIGRATQRFCRLFSQIEAERKECDLQPRRGQCDGLDVTDQLGWFSTDSRTSPPPRNAQNWRSAPKRPRCGSSDGRPEATSPRPREAGALTSPEPPPIVGVLRFSKTAHEMLQSVSPRPCFFPGVLLSAAPPALRGRPVPRLPRRRRRRRSRRDGGAGTIPLPLRTIPACPRHWRRRAQKRCRAHRPGGPCKEPLVFDSNCRAARKEESFRPHNCY